MKKALIAVLLICSAARAGVFAADEVVGPKGKPVIIANLGLRSTSILPGNAENLHLEDATVGDPAKGADLLMVPILTPEIKALGGEVETSQLPESVYRAGIVASKDTVEGAGQTKTEETAAEDPSDKPTMAALKRELRELSQDQSRKLAAAMTIGVNVMGAPSRTAMESVGRLHEEAARLGGKIHAKRGEIAALRQSDRKRYDALKERMAALKKARAEKAAIAASPGPVGHDYRGGTEEAAGRAYESVSELDGQIAKLKAQMGLIERDNPSFASLRAPVVMAMDKLGVGPMTPAERKLRDEIKVLSRESRRLRTWAGYIMVGQWDAPNIGAAENAGRMGDQAASIEDQIAAKKKQLAALR